MVTIVKIEKRHSKRGNEFFTLILQDKFEMVCPVETGQFYATVKKCSAPSKSDKESCKMILGKIFN